MDGQMFDTDTPSLAAFQLDSATHRVGVIGERFEISNGSLVVHWLQDDEKRCCFDQATFVVRLLEDEASQALASNVLEVYANSVGLKLTRAQLALVRERADTKYAELRAPQPLISDGARTQFDGRVLIALSVSTSALGDPIVSCVPAWYSTKLAISDSVRSDVVTHIHNRFDTRSIPLPVPTSTGPEVAVISRDGFVILGVRCDVGRAHDGNIQVFPGGEISSALFDQRTSSDATLIDHTYRVSVANLLSDEMGFSTAVGKQIASEQLGALSVVSSFGSGPYPAIDGSGIYTAMQGIAFSDCDAEEIVEQAMRSRERAESSAFFGVKLTAAVISRVASPEPISIAELFTLSGVRCPLALRSPLIRQTTLNTERFVKPSSAFHLAVAARVQAK